MSEAGRRILISGGTNGIGYACAERLCAIGDHVWVVGVHEESVTATQAALPVAGATQCDVSDAAAVDHTVYNAVDVLGGLDGVLVNAGIDGRGTSATDTDAEHFRRVLDVNVLGAFLVARCAARWMTGPASIVLTASTNALRPEPGFVDYNASKAAVVSIAKTMALELGPHDIAVTALCPGYFRTPMTADYLDDPSTRADLLARIPNQRFGNLTEIAGLVDFLFGSHARHMTGGVISIDGASSV